MSAPDPKIFSQKKSVFQGTDLSLCSIKIINKEADPMKNTILITMQIVIITMTVILLMFLVNENERMKTELNRWKDFQYEVVQRVDSSCDGQYLIHVNKWGDSYIASFPYTQQRKNFYLTINKEFVIYSHTTTEK